MATILKKEIPTKMRDIMAYASGDGVTSIMLNSILNFAMLYYTQVIGLDATLAGLAISISIFWDAVTDPIMGYISDNTRSKWGKRHPYMLLGGILSLFFFTLLWLVPEGMESEYAIFGWLMGFNLLMRTGMTIFLVPYNALGFEICTDYEGRSKIQGVRFAFGMFINILTAFSWVLFFQDTAEGAIKSTAVADNYVSLIIACLVLGVILLAIVMFTTRKYAKDTRDEPKGNGGIGNMFREIGHTLKDPLLRMVYIMTVVGITSAAFVGSVQIYVYEFFMEFSSVEKTVVHSSTMVAFAIGSLVGSALAKRIEKKGAILSGISLGLIGNILLCVLFVGGFVSKDFAPFELFGLEFSGGMLTFMGFHDLFWLGVGTMIPTSFAMVADVSEIGKIKTGKLRDGSYSAMLSFVFKASQSLGVFFSGFVLTQMGFEAAQESYSMETMEKVTLVGFLSAAVFAAIAIIPVWKYPITKKYLERFRSGETIE
ncbi:MFS transporter [Changchengzhania lutea]|uniref:MFS transporter n=1 Tax=Changchengzhania lutea TaxID=2049305 RepID=UPI00115EC69D|nr:MFS transporter [Changchengzhania lutea]